MVIKNKIITVLFIRAHIKYRIFIRKDIFIRPKNSIWRIELIVEALISLD